MLLHSLYYSFFIFYGGVLFLILIEGMGINIKHELFEVRFSIVTSSNLTKEIELLQVKEKLLLKQFTFLIIE